MNLDRLEKLVGLNNVVKLRNLNILIVGIGGVGGYAFEALVRAGISKFTIVDGDVIDETNLNRQIISNTENIGTLKVVEATRRARSINKLLNMDYMDEFLDSSNISKIDFKSFDYVVDACDTVDTKVLLINECIKNDVKLISCMGTAKKMHASSLLVTTLNKTSYDPLAKKIRKLVDKNDSKKIVVVTSTEEVKDTEGLGSNSYVPGVAGLLIADYIINDVCKDI